MKTTGRLGFLIVLMVVMSGSAVTGADSTSLGVVLEAGASSEASSADGEGEFRVEKDGNLVIEPYLATFEPAEFAVRVDAVEVLAWNRSGDKGRQLCVVNGVPDEKSMFSQKAGDFSPVEGLSYSFPVRAGQSIRVAKRGNYLPLSYLRLSGPITAVPTASVPQTPDPVGVARQEPLQSWAGSLWKPTNDSGNGSVVLLAKTYLADYQAGKWQSAVLAADPAGTRVVGGSFGRGRIVAPYDHKHPAVRFDKLGKHFGPGPIFFVIQFKDGRRFPWKITNPATRIEWGASQ